MHGTRSSVSKGFCLWLLVLIASSTNELRRIRNASPATISAHRVKVGDNLPILLRAGPTARATRGPAKKTASSQRQWDQDLTPP